MQLKNVAAVMVTASCRLRAAGPGDRRHVSSMGNAKSLRGGTADRHAAQGRRRQVYAMAQGNLIVGGAGRLGRRLQGADQPPVGRPHAGRRHRRAQRAHAAARRARRSS
jgi:flagellar basal body P-ring protein FlgI